MQSIRSANSDKGCDQSLILNAHVMEHESLSSGEIQGAGQDPKSYVDVLRNNQVVAGILIEGVTGAGKTQTLRALMHHSQFSTLLGSGRVFDEDETFGEVMTEIQEPGIPDHHYLRRLESVFEQLEQQGRSAHASASFVLERFHLSVNSATREVRCRRARVAGTR